MTSVETHANLQRKRGPAPDPLRVALRELFGEWSDRTFSTFYVAFRDLHNLPEPYGGEDAYKAAIAECTRPNGSLNVRKLARIAELAVFRWVASLDDDEREALL